MRLIFSILSLVISVDLCAQSGAPLLSSGGYTLLDQWDSELLRDFTLTSTWAEGNQGQNNIPSTTAGPFILRMVVRIDQNTTTNNSLIYVRESSSTRAIELRFNSANRMQVRVFTTSPFAEEHKQQEGFSTLGLSVGGTYEIVLSVDADNVRVFINSVEQMTLTVTSDNFETGWTANVIRYWTNGTHPDVSNIAGGQFYEDQKLGS
jgi:hypothetical protein